MTKTRDSKARMSLKTHWLKDRGVDEGVLPLTYVVQERPTDKDTLDNSGKERLEDT